jgi:hypothetical protein
VSLGYAFANFKNIEFHHIDKNTRTLSAEISLSLSFALFVIFCCLLARGRQQEFDSLLKRQLEFKHILDTANEQIFKYKGIHWSSGTYGAWIRVQLKNVYGPNTPD